MYTARHDAIANNESEPSNKKLVCDTMFIYPHYSYYGSTTTAKMMARQWAHHRTEEQHHKEHQQADDQQCWSQNNFCSSSRECSYLNYYNVGYSGNKNRDTRIECTPSNGLPQTSRAARKMKTTVSSGIPSTKKPKVDTKEDSGRRTIFTYKHWDGAHNQWSPTKIYKDDNTDQFRILLKRGGEISVFPNLIDRDRVSKVKKELLRCKFWRKYSIQGGDEPRLHFLAHEDATNKFEDAPQPGYRYANITMKAQALSLVPKLQQLSKDLAVLRNIPDGKWNIGVHSVLYRDNKDSMGDHADDDQGETRMLCVLLDSPPTARKVVVKVFDKLTGGRRERDRVHQHGDEFIELRLRPGDAYEMDGLMQESYSHCVPKDKCKLNECKSTNKSVNDENYRRICVVLRTGDQKYFEKDTGEPCINLSPRNPTTYVHGHISGLKEGIMYTRRELKKINAFQLSQRGISGSYESGADAIIVSGKRCGCDNMEYLKYVAEWRIGANSLVISFLKNTPVRVFRSAKYIRSYNLGSSNGALKDGYYRYDGLYSIIHVQAPTNPLGTFVFFLNRWSNLCFHPRLSFDSAVNELFRQRPLPDDGRKRPKWSRELGARDLSCCANLLSLGNEPSFDKNTKTQQLQ